MSFFQDTMDWKPTTTSQSQRAQFSHPQTSVQIPSQHGNSSIIYELYTKNDLSHEFWIRMRQGIDHLAPYAHIYCYNKLWRYNIGTRYLLLQWITISFALNLYPNSGFYKTDEKAYSLCQAKNKENPKDLFEGCSNLLDSTRNFTLLDVIYVWIRLYPKSSSTSQLNIFMKNDINITKYSNVRFRDYGQLFTKINVAFLEDFYKQTDIPFHEVQVAAFFRAWRSLARAFRTCAKIFWGGSKSGIIGWSRIAPCLIKCVQIITHNLHYGVQLFGLLVALMLMTGFHMSMIDKVSKFFEKPDNFLTRQLAKGWEYIRPVLTSKQYIKSEKIVEAPKVQQFGFISTGGITPSLQRIIPETKIRDIQRKITFNPSELKINETGTDVIANEKASGELFAILAIIPANTVLGTAVRSIAGSYIATTAVKMIKNVIANWGK